MTTKTEIKTMNKEKIDNEFRRVISTYDYKTLSDLFENQFNTKEKRNWIYSFHFE